MSTSPSFSTRKPHFIIGLGYLAVVLAFLAYHNETAARRDIALANRDAALANREAALAERDTTLSRIADLSKTTSMDLSKILPALQHVEHLSANSVAAETEPGFKSAVVKLARGVALELRRLSQFILSNPQADERQEQDTAVDKGRSGRHRPSFKAKIKQGVSDIQTFFYILGATGCVVSVARLGLKCLPQRAADKVKEIIVQAVAFVFLALVAWKAYQ